MLTREVQDILSSSKATGWVLEPEAKRLFSFLGLDVPRFIWAKRLEEAVQFAKAIGYPVVGKVVSPNLVHKSDLNGVELGIDDGDRLKEAFLRFSQMNGFAGMLVEEMISGIELIVGAKVDDQFGPIVLLGIGGTGVEIYKDVSLRMAPLVSKDVASMIRCLKGHQVLEGYRGSKPINLGELNRLLLTFSELVMDLESLIDSIDLNPIICSPSRCVVADARIMLRH
jgi:hypothetical protein